MPETKLIRVYTADESTLIELRRELTMQSGGEPASYADVVHWALDRAQRWLVVHGGLDAERESA